MINKPFSIKTLRSYRTFDVEGRPYPILDDDLDELLADSDFARPRRWGTP
jgi:hypothetical protein